MTVPAEIIEAVARERRRCVGIILAAVGIAKLEGREDLANTLDALATTIEHGEMFID